MAELSLLQDSRIACVFETGNTQLGNKRLAFAFKLAHSPDFLLGVSPLSFTENDNFES